MEGRLGKRKFPVVTMGKLVVGMSSVNFIYLTSLYHFDIC